MGRWVQMTEPYSELDSDELCSASMHGLTTVPALLCCKWRKSKVGLSQKTDGEPVG